MEKLTENAPWIILGLVVGVGLLVFGPIITDWLTNFIKTVFESLGNQVHI